MSRVLYYAVLVVSVLIALSQPAHAYLDPGTGSIILQAIVGAVAGVLVFGRTYLHRLKVRLGLSGRSSSRHDRPPSK
jgi:hypothetical protein